MIIHCHYVLVIHCVSPKNSPISLQQEVKSLEDFFLLLCTKLFAISDGLSVF